MGEIIFHIGILGALGLLFKETLKISIARATDAVGPAGFPKGIILLAVVLTVFSLYRAFKAYLVLKNNREVSLGIEELNIKFLGVLGSVIVFIFLNSVLGFFLSSLILVASIMYLLGNRERVKILIVTLSAAILFTIIFGRVLSVPLPRGMGIIRNISYLIY